MLGVSFDHPEDNAAFAEKFSFNYALLCDTERTMGLAYGACTAGTEVYARRIGVLIDTEGRIAAFWPKVDPAGFPAEVLARLG